MSVYISFPEWFVTGLLCVFLGLVIAGVVLFMSLGVNNVQKVKRRERWSTAKKDLIILHQMTRGRRAPTVMPFALKLETYLRMAGIPYENEFEEPFGPKEKCPWITMNNTHYTDSTLIMDFIKDYFKKDFSKHSLPNSTELEDHSKLCSRNIFTGVSFYTDGIIYPLVIFKN